MPRSKGGRTLIFSTLNTTSAFFLLLLFFSRHMKKKAGLQAQAQPHGIMTGVGYIWTASRVVQRSIESKCLSCNNNPPPSLSLPRFACVPGCCQMTLSGVDPSRVVVGNVVCKAGGVLPAIRRFNAQIVALPALEVSRDGPERCRTMLQSCVRSQEGFCGEKIDGCRIQSPMLCRVYCWLLDNVLRTNSP